MTKEKMLKLKKYLVERVETLNAIIEMFGKSTPMIDHELDLVEGILKTYFVTTVQDVRNGNISKLGLPVYLVKPYVIVDQDKSEIVLWAGDLEELKTDVILTSGYYDDREVLVREHDLYLNDNTKINC